MQNTQQFIKTQKTKLNPQQFQICIYKIENPTKTNIYLKNTKLKINKQKRKIT